MLNWVSNFKYDRKVTKKSLYTKYFLKKKCIFIKKNTIFDDLAYFL